MSVCVVCMCRGGVVGGGGGGAKLAILKRGCKC